MWHKVSVFYLIPLSIYAVLSSSLWCIVPKPEGNYDVDSYGYDPIAWFELYYAFIWFFGGARTVCALATQATYSVVAFFEYDDKF